MRSRFFKLRKGVFAAAGAGVALSAVTLQQKNNQIAYADEGIADRGRKSYLELYMSMEQKVYAILKDNPWAIRSLDSRDVTLMAYAVAVISDWRLLEVVPNNAAEQKEICKFVAHQEFAAWDAMSHVERSDASKKIDSFVAETLGPLIEERVSLIERRDYLYDALHGRFTDPKTPVRNHEIAHQFGNELASIMGQCHEVDCKIVAAAEQNGFNLLGKIFRKGNAHIKPCSDSQSVESKQSTLRI